MPRTRRACLRTLTGGALAFAVVLTMAFPAVAGATTPLRVRGQAAGLMSDGDRWLVQVRERSLLATDTDTGRQRTVAIAPGCAPRAMHLGLLLLGCRTPRPSGPAGPFGQDADFSKPYVLRLRTGTTVEVPNAMLGLDDEFGPVDPEWIAVGTQWLDGRPGCYHCEEQTEYVNWHTGERRSTYEEFASATPKDLDDPALRPLPKARRPSSFRYPTPGAALTVTFGGDDVWLSACSLRCRAISPGIDRYAWAEGRTVRGYVLTGPPHRSAWRLPGDVAGVPYAIAVTRRRVAVLAGPVTPSAATSLPPIPPAVGTVLTAP